MKTLYEVLELGRAAGPHAISAAYQRLADKYSHEKPGNINNTDAQNALKSVTEAHRILSEPQRKDRYDTFLASQDALPAIAIEETFWTPMKIGIALLIFILSTLGYYNYHLVHLEKVRQIAALEREKQEAETEAERLRQQEEDARTERQTQAIHFVQDVGQSIQTQQNYREGQQIIQQEIAAEQRAKMEAERATKQAAAAAERQSMQEKQKYAAQQRQEQYQSQMEQARQDRLATQQRMFELQQQHNQNALSPNEIKLRQMQAN